MPKILKPVKPEPLFPEPDHEPELQAQVRYEALRDGVKLRGVSEPEGVVSASETATEPPILVDEPLAFPAPRTTPATPEEIDHHHDCDQPSHQVWFIRWCADNAFPPPRDYVSCRGYRRLQARSVDELRGQVGSGLASP